MPDMTSLKPITIAVVGFSGRIGVRHTEHVIKCPDTELVALVDPSPTAAEIAMTLSPAKLVPVFITVAEMLHVLGEMKPQASIVCVPHSFHVPVAKELAAAGIDLLVEKPLCSTVEEGLSLLKDVQKHDIKLLVGHHKRFNHYVMTTKAILDSNYLGEITAVSALWMGYKPDEYYEIPWRRGKREGGVLFNNFVHDIDLLHYFFGPTIRVHAEKTITRRKHLDHNEDDQAEEGLAMTLRFSSGVVGTFLISDCVASPHNFEAATGDDQSLPQTFFSEEDRQEVDVYRIFGTEATLSVPDMTLWNFGKRKKSWESILTKETLPVFNDGRKSFERRLDHFVKVVREEEEPNCSGKDGLLAVMVCDAVRKALDSEIGTVLVPSIHQ